MTADQIDWPATLTLVKMCGVHRDAGWVAETLYPLMASGQVPKRQSTLDLIMRIVTGYFPECIVMKQGEPVANTILPRSGTAADEDFLRNVEIVLPQRVRGDEL